jgi:hypothetical protein
MEEINDGVSRRKNNTKKTRVTIKQEHEMAREMNNQQGN